MTNIQKFQVAALSGFMVALAAAQPTATITLASPQAGQSVSPGATVQWAISVSLSAGNNAGLALFSADLVQATTNPAFIDLPAAAASSDDGVPMQYFSRPLGISNPGNAAPNFGYLGSQRSPAGQTYKNLIQIGGGQNTFGAAGPAGIGQYFDVFAGVGQSGAQTIATGSFAAPATAGTYVLRLENMRVNALIERRPPPQFSPVEEATIAGTSTTFISFGVVTGTRGDSNCDGTVNFNDIDYFVAALVGEPSWISLYQAQHGGAAPPCPFSVNDVNEDSQVDFDDIGTFVDCLVASGCP